jgi:hypothetical protein
VEIEAGPNTEGRGAILIVRHARRNKGRRSGKYPDRKNLVLRYVDPITGQQKTKSAGTPNEADGFKATGKWEDELRSGRCQSANRLTWQRFTEQDTADRLSRTLANSR